MVTARLHRTRICRTAELAVSSPRRRGDWVSRRGDMGSGRRPLRIAVFIASEASSLYDTTSREMKGCVRTGGAHLLIRAFGFRGFLALVSPLGVGPEGAQAHPHRHRNQTAHPPLLMSEANHRSAATDCHHHGQAITPGRSHDEPFSASLRVLRRYWSRGRLGQSVEPFMAFSASIALARRRPAPRLMVRS